MLLIDQQAMTLHRVALRIAVERLWVGLDGRNRTLD